MSILSIPFKNYPSFSEDIVLESVRYTFLFSWNSAGSFWSMDVTNNDLETTVSGIRMVLNADLFQIVDRGFPPGNLVVIDQSGNDGDIAQDDFVNGRLDLIYVETTDPTYSGSAASSNDNYSFVMPVLLLHGTGSFLQFGNMRFVAVANTAVLQREEGENVWVDTGTILS